MTQPFVTTIKPSYVTLRSIYIEAQALREVKAGAVTVLLSNDSAFSIEGRLNVGGVLSGMAKLYHRLDLQPGNTVQYTAPSAGIIVVQTTKTPSAAPTLTPATPASATGSVFERQGLRHTHIELFRPDNLNHWEPETEVDVYLVFGVLQEYTDFQYCCGASAALLNRLGYTAKTEPDAIMIDRSTDDYLMAEWKKMSSDYKSNHAPQDVDLLVCWTDDETDRSFLPPRVLALREVARTAAQTSLDGQEGA